MRRILQVSLILLLLWPCTEPSPILCAQEAETALAEAMETPPIVKAKPSSGRFVELPDGTFMVPYTTTIPGTQVAFEMVPIAGGTFQMGSGHPKQPDQCPVFSVKVDPFWIGKHEVTWAEFEEFMKMTRVFKELNSEGVRIVDERTAIDAVTSPSSLYDPDLSYGYGDQLNHPAATMTQFSAKQYTKWLSLTSKVFYRLPYETEWEYACRAGTKTKYYFGNDKSKLKEHAWFEENSDDQRHAVGKLKPNPWGLHDMLGNVCEWTLDKYDADGYSYLGKINLAVPFSVENAFNPPEQVYSRCLRGGSWEMLADECTVFSRIGSDKEWKDSDPNFPKSPFWFTDALGTSAGMRIVRPLKVLTRDQQEEFWEARLAKTLTDVENSIEENGRGSKAIVDEKLIKDIRTHIDPAEMKSRPSGEYHK